MTHIAHMMQSDDTLILPTLEIKVASRAAFRGFLLCYGLSIQQVARAAEVPQLTIWSIDRAIRYGPITSNRCGQVSIV